MKNGLLIYRTNPDTNRFNIGDYIQSLAAAQFFDKIDMYVNREKLNEYYGDNLKLIMNGWFMHCQENWPPSPKINPLYVSFHLNSIAKEKLLNEESINHFKLFEPIGCRDNDTVKLLKSKGIDAYFSGCLTLTLSLKYKNDIRNNKIFFVDPYYHKEKDKYLSYLLSLVRHYKIVKEISLKKYKNKTLKSLIKTAAFYQQYIKVFDKNTLLKAEYISHQVTDNFDSEESKFEYAKSLLNEYCKANYIVTSRIHCALPCLSFETPVIYIDNVNQSEESYCRLNGLRDFFNIIKNDRGKMINKITHGKITSDSIFKNKSDHLVYKNKLINVCTEYSQK